MHHISYISSDFKMSSYLLHSSVCEIFVWGDNIEMNLKQDSKVWIEFIWLRKCTIGLIL
jgi:hypothetical protein